MTTSGRPSLPFVFTYAEPIARERCAPPVRYDRTRQLSVMLTERGWDHAVDRGHLLASTRHTEVAHETTDDD